MTTKTRSRYEAHIGDVAPPDRTRVSLWTFYRIRFTFLTWLCSSVPADPEIARKWIDARRPRVRPAGARSIEEINEEVLASLERGEGEADQEHSTLVFQKHAGYLVMGMRTVRGHYKELAGTISRQHTGKIEGEQSFAVRVKNGIYYHPREYWLPVRRLDGSLIVQADGAYDKAIHPKTKQGPISAIKTFEYIEPPSMIEFTLRVLNTHVRRTTKDQTTGESKTVTHVMPSVPEDDLHILFEYGGTHGYAGERGDGEGRYEYTLERIDDDTPDPFAAAVQRTPAPNRNGDHREARADS